VDIENPNRYTIRNEIEAIIKSPPTNKNPELDGFTFEFYQTFKKELTLFMIKSSGETRNRRFIHHYNKGII
jgi:hypothetical protein